MSKNVNLAPRRVPNKGPFCYFTGGLLHSNSPPSDAVLQLHVAATATCAAGCSILHLFSNSIMMNGWVCVGLRIKIRDTLYLLTNNDDVCQNSPRIKHLFSDNDECER